MRLVPRQHTWLLLLAIGLGASVWIGCALRGLERTAATDTMRQDLTRDTATLQQACLRLEDRLLALQATFRQSQRVDFDEFQVFAASMSGGQPWLLASLWAPTVRASEREAHEQLGRRLHGSDYHLRHASDGAIVARREDLVASPVLYHHPDADAEGWVGIDLASVPEWSRMLAAATASGRLQVEGPVAWHGADGPRTSYLMALPAQTDGASGHVLLVVDVETMFTAAVPGDAERTLALALLDPIWSPTAPLALQNSAPVAGAMDRRWSARLALGNRLLDVVSCAPERYLRAHSSLAPFAIGALVLLLSAGASLWLRRGTRRAVAIEAMVAQRTRALAEANLQLARSEARANSFFELGLIGLAELTPHGAIRRCNPEFAARLAIEPARLPGTELATFVADDGKPPLAEALHRLRARELDQRSLLLPIRTGRGDHLQANLGLRAVFDENGGCAQILAVLTDMTETLALIDHLQGARDAATAATRAKSEFLANMSHEIRTPMTAILGYTDLLRDLQLGAEAALSIDVIQRNGRHLLVLLDDILDLSKLEAGRLQIETVRFDLLTLIHDVLALLRGRAAAKDLRLEVELVGAVPTHVSSDPTRLRQILLNLLGNAIKFTDQGSVRLLVSCRRDGANGPRLHLSVVDTGIGMSIEQQRALFQPFTQGDTSVTRRFGGTGLGLAISQRLAGLLGGSIQVASEVGVGTTFRVQIGCGELGDVGWVDRWPDGSRAEPMAPAALPIAAAPLRVLIAEDGTDNQLLFRAVLRRAGYEVEIVDNGQLAVEAVNAAAVAGRPFAAVVLDMQMPVLDGYGAARLLRERGIDTPILACTAHAMADDRARCLQAGCSDYTSKPIDRRDLLDKLGRLVGGAPSGSAAAEAAGGAASPVA